MAGGSADQSLRTRISKMVHSPLAAETAIDRRRAVRRQPAVGTYFRPDQVPAVGRPFGLVWNISTGGMSLFMSQPYGHGERISGQLISNNGRHVVPIVFQVIHTKKVESGDCFLGGSFAGPLAEDEIRPFLFE